MTLTPRRRATIRDVANAAGISHATVSRYLNKRSYVSDDAAAAIQKAIVEVSYVPNRTARSLVSRKTYSVAFVVREHSDLFFADPNLSGMAIGANSVLSAAGYQMLLLIVESDASARRAVELIGGGSVDGAILLALEIDDPMIVDLVDAGTPLVTASTPVTESRIPSVDTDNEGGSRAITELLMGTGRQRIVSIQGPASAPVTAMRREGYRSAMGERYKASMTRTADEWTPAAGAVAMRSLLDADPGLDGVVAASDALAAGAIEALRAAGKRIPEDVAIVGFDDSPWATRVTPQLSTVRQNARATGTRMAEILLAQLDGVDMSDYHEVIGNQVIWRESAGEQPAVVTTFQH